MKILCVSLNHFPEQTGIGKYQGEMVEWLIRRGHTVKVVTAPPYYPEWKVNPPYSAWAYKTQTIAGARVFRVPIYVPATQGGLKRLLHLFSFTLTALPVIAWQSLVWRPDVIIATAPPLSIAPVVIFGSLIGGSRSLLHVQDFEVDAAFGLGLLKRPTLYKVALRIESWLLRGFKKVSTISPRMFDRLLAKGVKREKAVLIANWANIEDFDPARGIGTWGSLKTSPDTILAVYAGAMGTKQGLEVIVEAAKLLQDKPGIRFVICGGGAARQDIEQRAAGLSNVTFLPVQQLEEFSHLLIAADIHLMPQRSEAADLVMPSKLGNILASGRPVVASANKGTQIYDAVQGCGMAVEPENAQEFADAIAKLAGDKQLRQTLGAEARRRAIADWGRDSILTRMEAALS